MAMKTKSKAKAARPVKKAAKKAPKKAKTPALECSVCGYRVIVDETCGCLEEHILICCGQPMAKA